MGAEGARRISMYANLSGKRTEWILNPVCAVLLFHLERIDSVYLGHRANHHLVFLVYHLHI